MENREIDIEQNQQYKQELQQYPNSVQDNEVGTEASSYNHQFKYDENEEDRSLINLDQVRHKFVQKVYAIISCQLAVTAIMVMLALKSFWCAQNIFQNGFFISLAFIGYIGSTIALVCFRNQARRVPNNYLWLGFFTLCLSLITSSICSMYGWDENGIKNVQGQEIVLQAALLTMFVTLSLTFYAFYTDKDYTMLGAGLFLIFVSFFFFGIFAILSGYQFLITTYLVLSVLVYGFYLIYDTQLLMDRKSLHLEIDDYVLGAVFIYTDIIMLFLRILEILARSQRN